MKGLIRRTLCITLAVLMTFSTLPQMGRVTFAEDIESEEMMEEPGLEAVPSVTLSFDDPEEEEESEELEDPEEIEEEEESKELEDPEEIEEEEESKELEDPEEIEEQEENQEVEELEDSEEIEKPEENQEVEELENLEIIEVPEEIEEPEEIENLDKFESPEEIEDPEEIQKAEEIENPEEIEKKKEVENPEEVVKPKEIEYLDKFEETKEVEEESDIAQEKEEVENKTAGKEETKDKTKKEENAQPVLLQKSAMKLRGGNPLKAMPTHNIELTGTSSLTMIQGSEFKFFETDNINITTSAEDTFQYRVIVSEIKIPDGGSYRWDGTNYEKSRGALVSFGNADAGKTYQVTYQVQYQDPDDNNEWKDREGVSHTTEITVSPGATYDYVTDDVACVKDNLKLVVLADGTSPWDGDDKPGNDSSDKNLIVRTFDQVSYRAEYQTATKLGDDVYFKNAYLWVEITLPCTREKASIKQVPAEAITAKAPYEIQVGDETHTVYTYYYERTEHIDSSGHLNHALPEIGGFEFTMQVYSAKDGDTVKPKVGMAVCWTKVDENGNAVLDSKGNLVVEKPYTAATPGNGVYDYPRYAEGPDIRITARPGFNVTIHSLASTKSAKVHNFDATTNTDAPNYGIGKVYGRGVIFGVRVCLHSGNTAKGIRGMELPDGSDITFELEMGASIAKNPVDVPLVWDVSSRGRSMEYGRSSNGSYNSPSHLAYTPADMKKAKGTAFTTPSNGEERVSVWNGGDWILEQQPNGKVRVTIKNYVVNPFWFPNGYNSSQLAPRTAYLNNGNAGDYKFGVFSAKRLYMVVPFGSNITDTDRDQINYLSHGDLDSEYYYLNAYDLESGNIAISIRDKNLNITSASGKNSLVLHPGDENGQTIYTDSNDLLSGSVKLAKSGNLNSRGVRYSYNGSTASSPSRDAAGKDLAVSNGRDALMPGSKVQLLASVAYTHRDNYEDEWLRAGQVLVKFDDEFLTPTTTLAENGIHMFAAKADGWASDEEMKKTGMEELAYFRTMEEIEAAGMKCVGILRETIDTSEPKADAGQGFGLRVNDFLVTKDPAYYNKVCMISMQVKLWRQAEYDAIVELNGEFPLYRNGIPQGKTVEDYISEKYGVEKSEVKPWRDDLNAKNNLGYRKAYYDEDGYHAGSGTEPDWGDSLYVIPYRMAINNYVEQKDGPKDSTNPVEFSLERGENIADFCLRSRFVLPEGFDETELSKAYTTVTITNVLPKGLEYVPGSAYIGGTWKANPSNPGGHGTVEDYIEQREPSIRLATDGSGRLVLTWVFDNVLIGDNDALPLIHFATHIDEDVDKTTTWENIGRVRSTEDNRSYSKDNGNLDNAKISVSPSNALIVKKKADRYFYDRDDEITWTLRWKNKSNGAYANKVLMDVLPYDGDSNGSKIAKGYEIELIKYEFLTGASASGFNFYYTTDKGARSGDAIAGEFPYEKFVGANPEINGVEWKRGVIGVDGTPNVDLKEEIVAFALVGDMPGKGEVRATVTIKPNDTKGGDKYVNTISADSLRQTSQTQIVERGISGIVWREKGEPDGQRDASEIPGQGGVKVILKILNADGEWEEYAVTTTNKSGGYGFDDLPAGKFRVEFVNEDFDLSVFRATEQKKEGVSEHVNSDAKALYDEKVFAVIEDIVLPSAADMTTSRYYRENLDLGIWQPDLTVTKTLDLSALEDEEAAAKEKEREFLFRLTVPKAEGGIEYQMYDAHDKKIGAITAAELRAGFEFFLKDGEALRFENLPANTTYTLEEYDYEGEHYGYAQSLSTDSDALRATLEKDRNVKVINTYVPKLVEVNVSKTWEDGSAEGADGYARPANIKVDLLADEKVIDSVILNEDNQWEYSFKELPEYSIEEWPDDMSGGSNTPKKIQYTVEESLVEDTSWINHNGERRFYVYDNKDSIIGYFSYDATEDEETGNLTITNTFVPASEEEKGSAAFYVKKVDEEGEIITDNPATFQLVNNETKEVIVAETKSEDGVAKFIVSAEGEYTLTEKEAPEGYEKTDEEFTVSVEREGRTFTEASEDKNMNSFETIFKVSATGDWDEETLTLTVANEKIKEEKEPTEEEGGEVTFYVKKVDENGEAITGNPATFQLFKEGTKEGVAAKTGEEDGVAKFTLEEIGSYTLKETQAPSGFIKSADEYTITVEADGRVLLSEDEENNHKVYETIFKVSATGDWDQETLTLTVANKKVEEEEEKEPTEEESGEATFYVKKVDEKGEVITGNPATFQLFKEGTNDLITAETSEENGVAQFTVTEAGNYTLKEKRAPFGFRKTSEEFTITVEADGRVLVSDDEENNHKVYETVFKVSADGNWNEETLTLTVANERIFGSLFISKQVEKNVVYEGEYIDYYIVAINIGEGTLENVEIWDSIPEQLAYESDDSQGVYHVVDGMEKISWTIDKLEPNESVSFRLTTLVKECVSNKEKIINFVYGKVDGDDPEGEDEGKSYSTKDEASVTVKEAYDEPEPVVPVVEPKEGPRKETRTEIKKETKIEPAKPAPQEPKKTEDPKAPKTEKVKVVKKVVKHQPKTGDESNPWLWIGLMVLSLGAMGLHIKRGKRENK